MFQRLISLIGEEQFFKIERANILIVGIGGVGGYTLETLVRSGFKNITIIDGDKISESNLNRQIIALNNNIGEIKVEEAKKRALLINKDINICTINEFLTKDNFEDYVNENYDYIIDACDSIDIKLELIKYAKKNNIKIISALGMGKRVDSTKIVITMLDKTYNCPLAKKIRNKLREENIDLKIPVVFSSENVINNNKEISSCVFVPSVAGIYLANYVFKDILDN